MAWLKLIESAGNHLLALDPVFLDRLKPFYKKTFRIELTEPALAIDLRPCPDGFIISAAGETPPQVTLRGSLWAFARLAREGSHGGVFAEGRINMSGDAELGQAFQRVLFGLQIDWEELTAQLLGEAAAREIHRVFDDLAGWLGQSGRYGLKNCGEFLQEELGATPAMLEMTLLGDEIESLRADTARLEARVARLRATQEQPEDTQDA